MWRMTGRWRMASCGVSDNDGAIFRSRCVPVFGRAIFRGFPCCRNAPRRVSLPHERRGPFLPRRRVAPHDDKSLNNCDPGDEKWRSISQITRASLNILDLEEDRGLLASIHKKNQRREFSSGYFHPNREYPTRRFSPISISRRSHRFRSPTILTRRRSAGIATGLSSSLPRSSDIGLKSFNSI